jgi:N-methylhydantoinase B
MGARPSADGLSGIHTHMTNTMNTPIEALEHVYPLEVVNYSLRKNSGGKGLKKGGDGIVRTYHFLQKSNVSLLTERRKIPPYGLLGGQAGKKGNNTLVRTNTRQILPGKINFTALPGDRLIIKTPGGGGWGREE